MKTIGTFLVCFMLNPFCFSQVESIIESDAILDLEKTAINQLKLQPNRVASEFYVQKELPNHLNETVLLIPEIVNETVDEDTSLDYHLTFHILIVDSKNGKIKFQYPDTNWKSNALFISEITIDTAAYQLTKDKAAFGIKVDFSGSSRSNPYRYTSLSLYIKEGKLLKSVLDALTIAEYSGIVNVNSCYAETKTEKTELLVLDSSTNGFYDMQVKHTIIDAVFEANAVGDCEEEEKSRVEKIVILKYNKTKYE